MPALQECTSAAAAPSRIPSTCSTQTGMLAVNAGGTRLLCSYYNAPIARHLICACVCLHQVHSPSSSRPRDAAKRAFACAAQPDGNKSADVVNTDESGDLPGMPPPVDGMPPLGSLLRAHSGSAGTGTTSGGIHDDAGSSSSSSSSRGSGNASEVESRSSADSPGVRAALAALRWYRGVLSPLMTSTCR